VPLNLLVVDDDRKTVDLVRLYLERAGYAVQVAHDGRKALELARAQRPDLVVLDLMLPQLDGLDLCQVLRDELGAVPVIMLTARTTEADKLAGLETGADDYVTKPFSPRELVARVKAVLRRSAGEASGRTESTFGDLVVDHVRHQARLRGVDLHLTPREFRLLEVLAREPDRPFTREGLVERAFGFDFDGLERTVDAHIADQVVDHPFESDRVEESDQLILVGFRPELVAGSGALPHGKNAADQRHQIRRHASQPQRSAGLRERHVEHLVDLCGELSGCRVDASDSHHPALNVPGTRVGAHPEKLAGPQDRGQRAPEIVRGSREEPVTQSDRLLSRVASGRFAATGLTQTSAQHADQQ